jgi:exodeoxyribonuclease V beta subunit
VVALAGRRSAVLRELRISVPLELNPEALGAAFVACGGEIGARVAPAITRASTSRVRGILSGIIDIAAVARPGEWHIIDWKTNDLGRDPRAYSGHALEDAVASSLYPVQAALYMTLLTRWLRRIGDRSAVVASHYLYLRGMDARTPGVGVWSWSPGDALIAALDDALGPQAAAGAEEFIHER